MKKLPPNKLKDYNFPLRMSKAGIFIIREYCKNKNIKVTKFIRMAINKEINL
jgi:hypothetical protein